jgi:hypothetical protein
MAISSGRHLRERREDECAGLELEESLQQPIEHEQLTARLHQLLARQSGELLTKPLAPLTAAPHGRLRRGRGRDGGGGGGTGGGGGGGVLGRA